MRKGYKVKRYNLSHRYRSPGSIILRVFGAACFVCVLIFVGWNAYGPVMDYFSGALAAAVQTKESEELETPAPTPVPTPEPTLEPALTAEIHAVYLPNSVVSNTALLTARLEELARTDINAVMFDLKDTAGNVYYRSRKELVVQAQSQSAAAFDLELLCATLKEKDFIPIGRISAFRDPIGAANIEDAWVKYVGSDMHWLDNSKENGGKPWLNPYSSLAQAYISDLVSESVSMGVKRIVLTDVSFPTGVGLELASYGDNAGTASRSEVLSSFIAAMDRQVSGMGGMMSVYIPGPVALGSNTQSYGSNPLSLAREHIVLGTMPSQFGDGFTIEDFKLEKPLLDPYGTVDALLKRLSPDLTGKDVVALIQGGTAAGVEYNRAYTAEDITAQIEALHQNKINAYILYSADGVYPSDWP